MSGWQAYLFKTASPLQIFRATRIPVPTVRMFKSGIAKPGSSSYQKMWNLYRKIQYNNLRMWGATSGEAKKYQSRAPKFISSMGERYSKLVGRMSELTGVDPGVLALNIGRSGKELNELERSPKVIERKMELV